MRRVALIVLLSIATAGAADKPKSRFAPGPAASYPGHQTQDKITIAAIPYTTEEQAASAFGKVNPYKYGILPVLVVLTERYRESFEAESRGEVYRRGKPRPGGPAPQRRGAVRRRAGKAIGKFPRHCRFRCRRRTRRAR